MVLVNPAVATKRTDVKLLPVLKHLVPSFPGIANDIKKPGVDEHGYDRTPLQGDPLDVPGLEAAASRTCRGSPRRCCSSAPPRTTSSTPSSQPIITGRVSSARVIERTLPESYHVATLDNDAPQIFEESAEFVAKVTA